ncbi:CDK5RAP1-like protein [Bombus vosnesenskii]|uniref:CDK5RAP1-like protein n=1 Tax=Bombus vosnesenskii TaxID=207650 RepID=A0A6J3LED6_9HYME|nr:CDK5RAP1-like protein [Bombus vosnesenskii]XP_050485051.1 CDK5RAP1-like protein [Bombus huntii]
MIGTVMLSSLKQIKASETNCVLTMKWFIKKFARYNNVAIYNFQQCQTVYTTFTRLEIERNKEIERKSSDLKHFRDLSKTGPSLKDFLTPKIEVSSETISVPNIPYIQNIDGSDQKVYFEVYGCQMNVNDTEVIWSILKSHGYRKVNDIIEANIILLITCSIRDNAEQKVWNKLTDLNNVRKKNKRFPMKIGLLGCMAERLKDKILEKGKLVDVIAGPDSYKDLPRLLSVPDNETAINVVLSFDETYADVTPVRLDPSSTSAYVTIMRGCDNMCTYCIVPFTRGRERSRPIDSIVKEVQSLSDEGVKEVILLGQNVNSYRDTSQSEFYVNNNIETHLAKGFKTVYKNKKGGRRFVELLDEVSRINPEMRIRFTSPHPKDFPDEVLQLIAERPNICKQIHLPAQSGNSAVLERMRRGYTREAYIDLVHHIRETIPNMCFSSDFITGFCGETEEEFQDTLSLIELVKYNKAFLFSYSMREKTTAHRRYKDDVPPSVKQSRLERMISTYRTEIENVNKLQIGQLQLVLVEQPSKRSDENFQARNDGNTRVVIPSMTIPTGKYSNDTRSIKIGDYVVVKIETANSHSLTGTPLYHSSITEYAFPSVL